MSLIIYKKTFEFNLIKKLKTSQSSIRTRKGWLLHIKDSSGNHGWGEVSPIKKTEFKKCGEILESLKSSFSKSELEYEITQWPKALAFGIGSALGELDCLIGKNSKEGWLKAPTSALLMTINQPDLVSSIKILAEKYDRAKVPLTLKIKVGLLQQLEEEKIINQVLKMLPINSKIRLDANGSWSWKEANIWVDYLQHESRLEWLEQPLSTNNLEGLTELSKKIPIALDESLSEDPSLQNKWLGWQVRRPLIEGDPRRLLEELRKGMNYRMISTAFETGISQRWIHHLAALQQQGPTPTAPGLAPGWNPRNSLFSKDPNLVWESA